jgi:hypothetical protein
MCQANDLASGDPVSREGALHPGVGADANDTHGGWMRRRALEHPESILARDLLIASGWVEHLNAENARLREALEFYADPATYFAVGFMADPPCGEFVDDFSDDHGDDDLPGPRAGKRARAALSSVPRQSEDLVQTDAGVTVRSSEL